MGVYLILKVQNTLFKDPTCVTNEWKVKCKNYQQFDNATLVLSVDLLFICSDLINLHGFDLALSEILLTVCADQLLYNLNLIKLCWVCAKQNTAVKTASNACSMLAIQTLSDLV